MKHGGSHIQKDRLVLDSFPPFPSFPFPAREFNGFQALMGLSATLLLKRVRNFATFFISPTATYLKTLDFLGFLFVAQLLIYFNRTD